MRLVRGALPAALMLLAAAGPAKAIDDFFPTFGNNGIDVQRYDLDLDIDARTHRLNATALLTIKAERNLTSFTLDLAGLTVGSVKLDGVNTGFTRPGDKLRVNPASPIAKGRVFRLEVAYSGVPEGIDDPTSSDPGILPLGWINYDGQSYVVSEPVGAGSWYPVNDEPTDKASYGFVITVDEPYLAIANGVLKRVRDLGTRREYTFEQKQPMASYLAITDVGRFQVVKQKYRGKPITHYVTSDTPALTFANFRKVPAMLDFIAGIVGPYPFDAYGSIAISDPELYYALETQAISTFRNATVREDTVVHEATHQWFGDAVTVAQWRDLWLAEGFATYFEYLWLFRDDPAAFNRGLRQLYRYAVDNEVGPAVVSAPEDIFADNTYVRGALTLQALRLKVGDKNFFKILRSYYARYKNKNATSADFIAVAVKEGKTPGVAELLHDWLYEGPVPPLGTGTDAASVAAEVGPVTLAIPLNKRQKSK